MSAKFLKAVWGGGFKPILSHPSIFTLQPRLEVYDENAQPMFGVE